MTSRMTTEPEGLTRQEYVDWFAAIGLDANQMVHVDCGMDEITVTAKVQKNGHDILDETGENIAKYTIVIPVTP
jgi:hypothetical protein